MKQKPKPVTTKEVAYKVQSYAAYARDKLRRGLVIEAYEEVGLLLEYTAKIIEGSKK